MSESEYSSEDDEDYVPEEDVSEEDDDCRHERQEDGDDDYNDGSTNKELQLKEKEAADAKKAKQEELWSAFKKETAHEPVSKPVSSTMLSPSSNNKVSISRTYDFAGESVVVKETVVSDSKKEKKLSKEEEIKKTDTSPTVKPVSSGGFKRVGGLSSVLGQISKKPKLSTLEKSRLDWNSFKDQEGIHDELRNFNKDGYLEKQAFLQRADERQFEKEKKMREIGRKK